MRVEFCKIGRQVMLQGGEAREITVREQIALDFAKDDLDLIEPTGVLGEPVDADLNTNADSASSNTAFGAFALRANTTGSFNVAAGVEALANNTTGYHNTARGVAALSFNTIGINSQHGEQLNQTTEDWHRRALFDTTTLQVSLCSGHQSKAIKVTKFVTRLFFVSFREITGCHRSVPMSCGLI
jgi:hypothetical protein